MTLCVIVAASAGVVGRLSDKAFEVIHRLPILLLHGFPPLRQRCISEATGVEPCRSVFGETVFAIGIGGVAHRACGNFVSRRLAGFDGLFPRFEGGILADLERVLLPERHKRWRVNELRARGSYKRSIDKERTFLTDRIIKWRDII